MGFLNSIFSKSEQNFVSDNLFGSLSVNRVKGSKEIYLSVTYKFKPTGKSIGIFIDLGGEKLKDEQKTFFKNIEKNYKEIVESAKSKLTEEFKNWKENFELIDFENEFSLVSLSIPKFPEKMTWEMAFESIHDENHLFAVVFRDFEAEAIKIDG